MEKIIDNHVSHSQDLKTEFLKKKTDITTKCRDEVNAILEKYNCTFDVAVILTKNSIVPQINIIMKE